jgi:hypothetical protein
MSSNQAPFYNSFELSIKLSYILAYSFELSETCHRIASISDPITNHTRKEIRKVINRCKAGINRTNLIFHRFVTPVDFIKLYDFTQDDFIATQLAPYVLEVSITCHRLIQNIRELILLWNRTKTTNASIRVKARTTDNQCDKTLAAVKACSDFVHPYLPASYTNPNGVYPWWCPV